MSGKTVKQTGKRHRVESRNCGVAWRRHKWRKGTEFAMGGRGNTFLSEEIPSAKALPETRKLVDVTVSKDNS